MHTKIMIKNQKKKKKNKYDYCLLCGKYMGYNISDQVRHLDECQGSNDKVLNNREWE